MSIEFKQAIFKNWHPMRWVALVAGLFFVIQGLRHWDALSGLLGGFFLFQAISNTGCLVSRGCAVPPKQGNAMEKGSLKEVEFTEIKEH